MGWTQQADGRRLVSAWQYGLDTFQPLPIMPSKIDQWLAATAACHPAAMDSQPHGEDFDEYQPGGDPSPEEAPFGACWEGLGDHYRPPDFTNPYISDELTQVPTSRYDADDSLESSLEPEVDLPLAADELARLLTSDTRVGFARKALEVAQAKFEDNRLNPNLEEQRNAALLRYVRIIGESIGDSPSGLSTSMYCAEEIVSSPDATQETRDFIAKGLLLIGVAVVASLGAGAIGALVVKEAVWKEVIKSAIGAFVTGVAALAAERFWRKRQPERGND